MLAVLSGIMLSAVLGALINPLGERPRVPSAYALCSGLAWWLAFFAVGCLLTQRLYFAITLVVVLHGVLLAVNHAKFTALREPFILQDFEYFTDALRHPRLYIPFFGIVKTLALLGAGGLAIGLFIWFEPPLYQRHERILLLPLGALSASAVLALLGWFIRPPLSLHPVRDMQSTGLIALLHSHLAEYWRARKRPLNSPAAHWPEFDSGQVLPHLVMVQSESFFDPRTVYGFVKPSVMQHWDRVALRAVAQGRLEVPAWGANTVRTEAAVLTGLSPDQLGIHQFNPYRRLIKKPVASLASHLRSQGYRTVCVHPYPAHFYQREQVIPILGFDEFIDGSRFDIHDHCGQYVGDKAVADRVSRLLQNAEQPLFVFVITMENHGPLHLETPASSLAEAVYTQVPQGPLSDLSVYLGHLQNADAMLAQLVQSLEQSERGGSLCWYGDHVPIMPDVYRHFGEPEAATPWLIFDTACESMPPVSAQTLRADQLAQHWLEHLTKFDILTALKRRRFLPRDAHARARVCSWPR
jgi:hypothetical protein